MRLQTVYSQHRTDTSRLSSGLDNSDEEKGLRGKVMALQNVPKRVRDIVVAPPGYALIGGDYKAIEWVVATWYAMCYNIPKGFHAALLEKFLAGNLDPHTHLATVCYSAPKPDKDQRQSVKPYTYGYLFDGAPSTLAREAGHPDRIGKMVCHAHDLAFAFRPIKTAIVEEATRLHCVTTPLGWCRWFWAWNPKPTEILGTKIQGTAAGICLWILRRMFDGLPAGWEILSTTHDSYLLMVPEKDREKGMQWLRDMMTQPIPWMGDIRCLVEIYSGRTWRDVS